MPARLLVVWTASLLSASTTNTRTSEVVPDAAEQPAAGRLSCRVPAEVRQGRSGKDPGCEEDARTRALEGPRGLRAIWGKPVPLLPKRRQRFIMRSMLTLFGRDVLRIEGVEHLAPEHDPFVLVMNHTTRLEALLLPVLFAYHRRGKMVSFIADWNFALIPGIATILREGESILLVRKPAKPAFLNVFRPWFSRKGPAFERAAQVIGSGRSVGIFPEGTTNRHPTRLLRGFDGAARLSLETGCPVVPAGVRFPGQASDRPVRDRTPMEVVIGAPLVPTRSRGEPSREEVRAWHSEIMREIGRLSGKTWEPKSARRKYHGLE
jgi:1-acyl-sn-glycerol-3-phosphate acyltransferase